MIQVLALPFSVVQMQLWANFSYGVYGLGLFVLRPQNTRPFQFLITMNFVYAACCLAMALWLYVTGIASWGVLLILAEAAVITALAFIEYRYITAIVEGEKNEHRIRGHF